MEQLQFTKLHAIHLEKNIEGLTETSYNYKKKYSMS